jgi:hypothetical protein
MKSEIQKLINSSLDKLYLEDKYLIEHKSNNSNNKNKQHVSERAIVFRFGIYLQELVYQSEYFKYYNIDMEYNRNHDDCKSLSNPKWKHGAYPDLIIHKRGSNKSNLLVIEFKTWWNDIQSANNDDKEKLRGFKQPPYSYQHALFIMLNKYEPKLEWIE